ncbi:RNA polymerase sigma factor SigY [Paenibacillus albiflavus]|uniref:RNA polymerase sigma factor SigY n=1 Tax=Paenibacillus albiflavus TaxID=2545760 RepID=A0A4R4EHE2_9BACL|nr:RNA polymerase sigma factor SigY [Paenibacillus albiflavus]TCZ78763.1 RNA polymerase sigma factor SigY [Paenibacillus albiflavus]
MEEQERINQAIRGNEQALAHLLHDHYAFLMKYLLKVTMNPALAEDLTQDTMLKCIEKIHLYNGKSKFSSWLITIASRLYIDGMRRNKLERKWQESQKQPLRFMQWQMGQTHEQWSDILEAMATVSYETRLPVMLKHYYGYSYEEIAEIINVPVGTVKSRIYNGLRHIRKELNDIEQSENG